MDLDCPVCGCKMTLRNGPKKPFMDVLHTFKPIALVNVIWMVNLGVAMV